MLLVKYSEPLLKSNQVRVRMEETLLHNIRGALKAHGAETIRLKKSGGLIYVDVSDEEKFAEPLQRIFGINSVSVSSNIRSNPLEICEKCVAIASNFKNNSSFAIRARRTGTHSFSSQELAGLCGSEIQEKLKDKKLTVDLSTPDYEIFVEVRDEDAFIYEKILPGVGGLPVGSEGKMLCVISDSFHSLISVWMMAKRGVQPILLLTDSSLLEGAKNLKKWFASTKVEVYCVADSENKLLCEAANALATKLNAKGVITGHTFDEIRSGLGELKRAADFPIFMPLIGLSDERIAKLGELIGLNKTEPKQLKISSAKNNLEEFVFLGEL